MKESGADREGDRPADGEHEAVFPSVHLTSFPPLRVQPTSCDRSDQH